MNIEVLTAISGVVGAFSGAVVAALAIARVFSSRFKKLIDAISALEERVRRVELENAKLKGAAQNKTMQALLHIVEKESGS